MENLFEKLKKFVWILVGNRGLDQAVFLFAFLKLMILLLNNGHMKIENVCM